MERIETALEALRVRIVDAATDPFGHAPYPLARSLDHRGDPGLFGPGSVSWRVIGDTSAFVGGIRALLVQAAHPEVVAGVADHSRYREDPLGRLSRTSAYVTATTYGAMPEVRAAIDAVRGVHRPVRGRSHRARAYSAGTPRFAAWVHNALTDSFLVAYQAYGPRPLTPEEADRFVAEQRKVGALLDADPMPATAADLRRWIDEHPEVGRSPGMEETVAFLSRPPLRPGQRAGYRLLAMAAIDTIPDRILDTLGLGRRPGGRAIGRRAVSALRWALGSSPSWRLALARTGADEPAGIFKQPLPSG